MTTHITAFMSTLFLCLVCMLTSQAQTAQDTGIYLVETNDGNEYLGTIVFQDAQVLRLHTTKLGEITLQKQDIRRMTRVKEDQIISGEHYFENPQSTRYLWAPNGYGLKAGEGYYQNIWVMFNQAAVGVTDHFSIGLGMVPVFFFAGASTPVWITPKVSLPVSRDKFNLGIGALAGTIIGEDTGVFGITYGVATLGSRDRNASLGVGYGFADGQWSNAPVVTLSGMLRTGKRGYFLTENYVIPTDGETVILLSFGGRRMIRRSAIDFGLIIPMTTGGSFFAIPLLGVTFPFGR
jgi:hypothetical protein